MTTYITQEQAEVLARKHAREVYKNEGVHDAMTVPLAALPALCNAAIQHYRDSLVAGVVLPEPTEWHVPNGIIEGYTADQLRQGIADALAKQEKYWQTQVAAALNGKFEPLSGKQVPQWLPIETAPTSEDAPFMVFVPRDSIGDGVAVQVSMFEGRLYPDGKDSCIDWDDAITSATHWATRLETPITKAAK